MLDSDPGQEPCVVDDERWAGGVTDKLVPRCGLPRGGAEHGRRFAFRGADKALRTGRRRNAEVAANVPELAFSGAGDAADGPDGRGPGTAAAREMAGRRTRVDRRCDGGKRPPRSMRSRATRALPPPGLRQLFAQGARQGSAFEGKISLSFPGRVRPRPSTHGPAAPGAFRVGSPRRPDTCVQLSVAFRAKLQKIAKVRREAGQCAEKEQPGQLRS